MTDKAKASATGARKPGKFFHAAKVPGQVPGTVIELDGELWCLGAIVREIVRTAQRHGLLRQRLGVLPSQTLFW